MANKSGIVWTIKEVRDCLVQRVRNKFDVNIGVSGSRGNGKSTFILKLFLRFPGFNQWKHQVYRREDVIDLLKNQTLSYCWDDEGINSGFKRDFQQTGQKDLIKIITNYRDNYNIYASALPSLFSLDKELRKLIFLHVHILERGMGVLFMPLEDSLHSEDPWDSKNNTKLEEKWNKRKQENPNFKIPYHKFSTFAGYIFYNDCTVKQRLLYEQIKKTKRGQNFLSDKDKEKVKEYNFLDTVLELVLSKKISKEGLIQICLANNKKYSAVSGQLNSMLKDKGIKETLSSFIVENVEEEQTKEDLNKLLPEF